jgi:hypothetical protein
LATPIPGRRTFLNASDIAEIDLSPRKRPDLSHFRTIQERTALNAHGEDDAATSGRRDSDRHQTLRLPTLWRNSG